MIILLALVAMIVGGIVWSRHDDYADAPVILIIGGGAVLLIALLGLAVIHISAPADLARVEAMRATYEASRVNGTDPLERAALVQQAATINGDIASWRAYNGTLFGLWVPEVLASIDPIR